MSQPVRATFVLALVGLSAACRPEPTSSPSEQAGPVDTDETSLGAPLPERLFEPKTSCRREFDVGAEVRDFALPSVDGDKTISPSGYGGRVVLLNFWGTWCKPCLEELPRFDQLYRRYRGNGLTLVAVATDTDPRPVQDFIAEHELRAKVALSGEDAAGAYDRPNFPFTFVVDGEGEIVAAYEFVDDSCLGDLEGVIRAELETLAP
jgi:peroxiredoxin